MESTWESVMQEGGYLDRPGSTNGLSLYRGRKKTCASVYLNLCSHVLFGCFSPCREYHRQLVRILIRPILSDSLYDFVVNNAVTSRG